MIDYHVQDLLKTFLLRLFYQQVQTGLLFSVFKHQDGNLLCIQFPDFRDDGTENLLLLNNIMEYGVPMERVKVEALLKHYRLIDKDPDGFFVVTIDPLLLQDTSGSQIRPELQLLLINGIEDFAARGGQVVDDALVDIKFQILGDLC